MKLKYFLPNKTVDQNSNKFLVIIRNFFLFLIKEPLRFISKNVSYDNCNKITSYSLNNSHFKHVKKTQLFNNRELLWESAIREKIDDNSKIAYLEFGVFEGKSIKYFSKILKNKESKFFGFDTFTGMPEKWNKVAPGSWSNNGNIPQIEDKRVFFVKGLFQETLDNYLSEYKSLKEQNYTFLIHLDADLYSSTLYVLSKLSFLDKFYVIFDEFTGDENRALKNFLETYVFYEVEFYSHTLGFADEPHRVFCKISKKI